ncbi:MAG TPA: hypothetical protein PLP19_21510 [bacterium]|nr:hypothetical protein [bacterium]HPN46076.1 hypothetical protein [bacterium]
MKNNIEDLALAYLECRNDLDKKLEIKHKLLDAGMSGQELAELEKVTAGLSELAIPDPGERMTDNFYTMLSAFSNRPAERPSGKATFLQGLVQTNVWRFAAVLAFSLLLFFSGWGAGYWLTPKTDYNRQINSMNTEIANMKTMLTLTLLTHSSPAERLQGIYQAASLDTAQDAVIYALLQTLHNDPNVNVRLVAIKTLQRFADKPLVRAGLVQAISTQYDSQVLLLLADVMLTLQEKSSVAPMQTLLKTRVLESQVREKIEKTILTLI